MQDVEVIPVIRTRLLRKGEGRDTSDPIRIIEQYWDVNGNLLWQIDPCADLTIPEAPARP